MLLDSKQSASLFSAIESETTVANVHCSSYADYCSTDVTGVRHDSGPVTAALAQSNQSE